MVKYFGKKVLWAVLSLLLVSLAVFLIIELSPGDPCKVELAKPVIYLYPESVTDVEVLLTLDGSLGFTYPEYGNGWRVTAYPDGTLVNRADGAEYGYLFWEGEAYPGFDMSEGFVVAGGDTAAFLREKLAFMGLSPKEYNDFIVYWAPLMRDNAYNLISFQGGAYTDIAKLEVSPAPDSMLRVFMAFRALEGPADITEQELAPFERTGFTVVEWGGAEIN